MPGRSNGCRYISENPASDISLIIWMQCSGVPKSELLNFDLKSAKLGYLPLNEPHSSLARRSASSDEEPTMISRFVDTSSEPGSRPASRHNLAILFATAFRSDNGKFQPTFTMSAA